MKGLTYDDIYLIPRYNGIPSRKDVDPSVTICGERFALPVISSPMDTITETEMAVKMADMGGLGLIHRFNTIEEQKALYEACRGKRAGIAFGTGDNWQERVEALYSAGCRIFCLDVAHGHSHVAGTVCKEFKSKYTDTILIAGSVCTHEGALYLESCGADMIRVGVSNGCFLPDTKITTSKGLKSIQDIEIGEKVLTHTGQYQEVINTLNYDNIEKLISINGIVSTKLHEYYVVNKEEVQYLTEDNIHDYAYWIEAWELNKGKHMLIKAL